MSDLPENISSDTRRLIETMDAADAGFDPGDDAAFARSSQAYADEYSTVYVDASGQARFQGYSGRGTRNARAGGSSVAEDAEMADPGDAGESIADTASSAGQGREPEDPDLGMKNDLEAERGAGSTHTARDDVVAQYLDTLHRWEGRNPKDVAEGRVNDTSAIDIVTDGEKVDELREYRLDLARQISADPRLASHRAFFERADEFTNDPRRYFEIDNTLLRQGDKSKVEYSDFARRREELRDQVFGKQRMVDADSYVRYTKSVQGMLRDRKDVDYQYEFLDIRREAAREHYNNPRFVAEVALRAHVEKGDAPQKWDLDIDDPRAARNGFMDELLVDFDREDLLNDKKAQQRSDALTGAFTERLREIGTEDSADGSFQGETRITAAEKVRRFQDLREAGMTLRTDHRAVGLFAQIFNERVEDPERKVGVNLDDVSSSQRSRCYEIGLAALEDRRFSKGLFNRWVAGLDDEERSRFHKELKGSPTGTFRLARERFERQYAMGDKAMADSFAVMETAASKVMADPKLVAKLRKTGEPDDLVALQMFSEESRDKRMRDVSRGVQDDIVDRMGQRGHLTEKGARLGDAAGKTSGGEDYKLDLSAAGENAHCTVVDGSHLMLSNSAEDAQQGKGLVLRLQGMTTPPVEPATMTKSGVLDAGVESKNFLEEVIGRHGLKRSVGLVIDKTDTGEKVVKATLNSGEDVSERMIKEGYALPTKDGRHGERREDQARQAQANKRGLWKEGFPEMDDSWRREKNAPQLTWRDKKHRLVRNVNDALAQTPNQVYRKLSRPEARLFALPVKEWAGDGRIDEEVESLVARNPARAMDVYGNNMDILKDLRKRKDSLSQEERVAHDRLSLGRRALASSLVSAGHLDPRQAEKDSHPLVSRPGFQLNAKKIRPIAEGAVSLAGGAAEATRQVAGHAKNWGARAFNEAME